MSLQSNKKIIIASVSAIAIIATIAIYKHSKNIAETSQTISATGEVIANSNSTSPALAANGGSNGGPIVPPKEVKEIVYDDAIENAPAPSPGVILTKAPTGGYESRYTFQKGSGEIQKNLSKVIELDSHMPKSKEDAENMAKEKEAKVKELLAHKDEANEMINKEIQALPKNDVTGKLPLYSVLNRVANDKTIEGMNKVILQETPSGDEKKFEAQNKEKILALGVLFFNAKEGNKKAEEELIESITKGDTVVKKVSKTYITALKGDNKKATEFLKEKLSEEDFAKVQSIN